VTFKLSVEELATLDRIAAAISPEGVALGRADALRHLIAKAARELPEGGADSGRKRMHR
jgi:hypothetical protein